jgi:hypothetical protein
MAYTVFEIDFTKERKDMSAQPATANAKDDIADRPESYHIRFSTDSIAPDGCFPTFQYVCTNITFDRVVYTAVLYAMNVPEAMRILRASWQDVQVQRVIRGRSHFSHDDVQLAVSYLGCMQHRQDRSLWGRIRGFFQMV